MPLRVASNCRVYTPVRVNSWMLRTVSHVPSCVRTTTCMEVIPRMMLQRHWYLLISVVRITRRTYIRITSNLPPEKPFLIDQTIMVCRLQTKSKL